MFGALFSKIEGSRMLMVFCTAGHIRGRGRRLRGPRTAPRRSRACCSFALLRWRHARTFGYIGRQDESPHYKLNANLFSAPVHAAPGYVPRPIRNIL